MKLNTEDKTRYSTAVKAQPQCGYVAILTKATCRCGQNTEVLTTHGIHLFIMVARAVAHHKFKIHIRYVNHPF